MSVKKLIAIAIIFLGALAAWMILGVSNLTRTNEISSSLSKEVRSLYGSEQYVKSPQVYYLKKELKEFDSDSGSGKPVMKLVDMKYFLPLASSDVQAKLTADYRKKGVLWFSTYKTDFTSHYTFANPLDREETFYFLATLDSTDAIYDNVALAMDGKPVASIQPLIKHEGVPVRLKPGAAAAWDLSYRTTGMNQWRYQIAENGTVAEVNRFKLTLTTDFKNIDFPDDSISPTSKQETQGGWTLTWAYQKVVTGKSIGLSIPDRLNPGEIANRMTFFAPVPLLFYFFLLVILAILWKVEIHPMNYLFLAGGFFAFHLFFAYFSDHMDIYLTFAIASFISLALNATYLRIFAPGRFAWGWAPLAQFVYLVVFSFSFFFKGVTGMILTVASVLTLFILMQLTGRLDWNEVFAKSGK